MRKSALILLCTLGMVTITIAQPVNDLFRKRTSSSKNFSNVVSASQALTINSSRLSSLKSQSPSTLVLELPFEDSALVLDLHKSDVVAPGFRVTAKSGSGTEKEINWNDGTFYQGKVRGKEHSMATISITGGEVMGIVSDDRGNIILGAIEQNGLAKEEYTLYRESALKVKNPSACFASEEMIGTVPQTSVAKGQQTGQPIEIYFECDYRLYTDRSSNVNNVVNFVLGFFNNTAAIYEAEDIKVQVSQITVWTTLDPEAAQGLNTTDTVLDSFAGRMLNSNYKGDYAHFLSRRNLGGGIAYVLGNPCASNITRYYKTGVSAIDNNYLSYPTYSWTVQVVTHELGHNFGSNHTQWCGWSGGALDNCYPTEPVTEGAVACPRGPAPVNGGTIMSYCHLTGAGINFANGFGTQPGNRIRQVVGAATCFGACKMTVSISKVDASCGQPNGTATVTTTSGSGAMTYLWSNGQTGATLTDAAPGTYNVTVRDASGCQVMEDVTIANSGTFAITAGGPLTFCAGKNVVLSTIADPAYGYSWTRNGTVITGASSASYTATASGDYRVLVTGAACPVTSAAVTVSVSPIPDVVITPASITIEKFETATFNVSGAPSYDFGAQPNLVNFTANTFTVQPPVTTTYNIRGYNAIGCEDVAQAQVIVVGCGQVTNIDTVNLSPSRVLVSWTNPQDVTTDTLEYRKVGDSAWTRVFVTGNSYEISGLQPGTGYQFRVTALCSGTNTFIASAAQAIGTPTLPAGTYTRLFPNPSATTSRLEVISTTPYELSVEVYDHRGSLIARPVRTSNLPAGQTLTSINVQGFAAGVYHVAVRINGKTETIRMVVAH